MPSFDNVSRVDIQEVENAHNNNQKSDPVALRFPQFKNGNRPGQKRKANPRDDGRRYEAARSPRRADRESGEA